MNLGFDSWLNIFGKIIAYILISILLSFVGVTCWTYLTTTFSLPVLNFKDFLCIYWIIFCLFRTIAIGLNLPKK